MAAYALGGRQPALVCRPPSAPYSRQTMLQIEFYFSDSNLPRDKFLSERVAADPDGYVDIALLCIFQVRSGLLACTLLQQL